MLSLYEDFLCPVCGEFEQQFGPTITQADRQRRHRHRLLHGGDPGPPGQQNYSSRAATAAYCVADEKPKGGVPALPRRAVRPAAQRDGGRVPDNAAADRDRAPGRRRRQGAGLHQQRPLPRHGRRGSPRPPAFRRRRPCGSTARTTSSRHARRAGRQDQGDRRRRSRARRPLQPAAATDAAPRHRHRRTRADDRRRAQRRRRRANPRRTRRPGCGCRRPARSGC